VNQPWWKNEVIYQIYPMSFMDSNGDGIGDLHGIREKLDYIQSLGVTMIWTSPFFASPNDDNGYDISDYTAIDPDYGTMDDFDQLLAEIKSRGMKWILDTVVSHSSDEHPWFIESSSSKDNPKRDYYIWRDAKADGSPPTNWKAFFGGSTWQWHEKTGQYYLHLFRTKQPDLNWENPEVRKSVKDVLRFWLEKGIDGYRMDVISLISKRLEMPDAPEDYTFEMVIQNIYSNGPRIHEFLKELYKDVFQPFDAYTMGEGPGIVCSNVAKYVNSDRNELSTIYHFDHLNLDHGPGGRFDLREWQLSELKKIVIDWDEAIGDKGWYCFSFGNHDFGRMVSRYGSKKYEKQSAKALAVILLSLRATPIIYQGDEIGMTNTTINNIEDVDDVYTTGLYEQHVAQGGDKKKFMDAVAVQSRDHARTPMQWNADVNGGFSNGSPWLSSNPNHTRINVASQENDDGSVLSFYKKMIAIRKESTALNDGSYIDRSPTNNQVWHFVRTVEGEKIHVVVNCTDLECDFPDTLLNSGDKTILLSNYDNVGQDKLLPWQALIYKSN